MISEVYDPVENGKDLRHRTKNCEQLKVTMQIEISTAIGN
tara:strand:- start:179 stop:298 length:120 start_codon:yes stop_codon:yes gene_type:complete